MLIGDVGGSRGRGSRGCGGRAEVHVVHVVGVVAELMVAHCGSGDKEAEVAIVESRWP